MQFIQKLFFDFVNLIELCYISLKLNDTYIEWEGMTGMEDQSLQVLLAQYLDKQSPENFRVLCLELDFDEAQDLAMVAIVSMAVGRFYASRNIVSSVNMPRALVELLKPEEHFVLFLYRDNHLIGLDVCTCDGVIFQEVVKCGGGVLKLLADHASDKIKPLSTGAPRHQFIGWCMRQFPIQQTGWDLAT